ncbi:Txe/YoeB family addiction module toxin [Hymenobacter sp. M29]|uniref:Putative mRNA interferase YoeB n=1 Tax=Hymenobacter mellowenesis TaxID=3063995 RepID=A0ABT9AJV9_9BACT|nr:Txe/YoeB family addiction module toxin [Hymenobacter sp. M29]MDO7849679.1 Txe/YoeB family addiction module toxin [Hymenobacter sp. M29]
MRLIWDEAAWEQYLYWQETDRAILRKINTLLKECQRTPFAGTGKPEALKGDLRGYWSRRINHEHRLVYKAAEDGLRIAACRFHYGDK